MLSYTLAGVAAGALSGSVFDPESAAGSALGGGLLMLAFGIGTLPVLMTAGFLAGLATRIRRYRHLNKLAGASLVVMGTIGLGLVDIPHVHHEHIDHERMRSGYSAELIKN